MDDDTSRRVQGSSREPLVTSMVDLDHDIEHWNTGHWTPNCNGEGERRVRGVDLITDILEIFQEVDGIFVKEEEQG